MKNALKCLAVVITLISILNVTALAVPTDGNLQLQNDSLKNVRSQREKMEMQIEQFDNDIEANMIKTQENKVKIAQTEKTIKIVVAEVKQVDKQVKKESELFNSRMRTMYINGFDGYTNALLSSASIGDFISRLENIKTIIAYDKEIIEGFEATQNKLNEKQLSLKNTKNELLTLQAENKQKLDKIILAKTSQSKLIIGLISKENLLAAQEGNAEVAATASIPRLVVSITPSRGSFNLSENAITSFAAKFLGTPYRWGGTSPSTGFDCSGFTQYVYAHFGISIGRSTGNQIRDGVQVSRANLQPGDLVFFGGSSPSHTGIYLGGNNYIHSPRTGDVIKVSAMTRGDFITGRRVR